MKFKEWFLQEYTKDKSRRLQLAKKFKKADWAARPEIYENKNLKDKKSKPNNP